MAFFESTALLWLACGGLALPQAPLEEPEYPLGKLRLPPIAEPADPFRLVDLRYRFSEDGATVSSFETRLRLFGFAFVGGEVRGDARGLFFDTQRLELGLTEEDGRYQIETGYRAPWFLAKARAEKRPDEAGGSWIVAGDGAVRFGPDLELLLSYREDLDDTRATAPSVERFARTGALPPAGLRTRELRSGSAGILYQRANHLETRVDAGLSRVRTEQGFDLTRERYRLASLWNRPPFQMEGELGYERTKGRISQNAASAAFELDLELTSHLVAHLGTLQRWEPGVLRSDDEVRFGITFFGRRHRFARADEAAVRMLELQKRAVELGYNERRVYEIEALRAFRERLGISPAREELALALDALYRAQVRERNVPQLGLEVLARDEATLGLETRIYRGFVAIPWRVDWPFARNERFVDFLRFEFTHQEERFSSGLRAISRAITATVFLNREMSLRFQWEAPGRTPVERAQFRRRPSRITLSYDYALGR